MCQWQLMKLPLVAVIRYVGQPLRKWDVDFWVKKYDRPSRFQNSDFGCRQAIALLKNLMQLSGLRWNSQECGLVDAP